MPTITALLHTHNDALRLGRCLETLYPCDDILIYDHASIDATTIVAHDYGARVVAAAESHMEADPRSLIPHAWLLCLEPCESLSESLAASLYEWKLSPSETSSPSPFSVLIREETAPGWSSPSTPQTRLVPPGWMRWVGNLPVSDNSAPTLDGEILRFSFP